MCILTNNATLLRDKLQEFVAQNEEWKIYEDL